MERNKFAVKLIEKYQSSKPPGYIKRCIHYPTCSEYSKECYKKFNFFKASLLTFKRILFCTPLNHKTYDPVPLSKTEKMRYKALDEEAKKFTQVILLNYKLYPLMEVTDFIKMLYQSSFGPNHLLTDEERALKELKDEIKKSKTKETQTNIGGGFIRVNLGYDSNSEKIFNAMKKSIIQKPDYELFYHKLNLLNSLIKKGQLEFNKKDSQKIINDYMFSNLDVPSHSRSYYNNYHPHYRIIKKDHFN